jgi:hypothetical protein
METQPARTPPPVHAPKAKPDPRPMRVALGFGGVAALSALTAAIVLPPRPVTSAPVVLDQPASASGDPAATPDTSSGATASQRPILYVQLAPGQTAPPGATVIDAPTPTPGTASAVKAPAAGTKQASGVQPPVAVAPVPVAPVPVAPVQATPVPAPPKPAPTPIVIKTTQSGKVIP